MHNIKSIKLFLEQNDTDVFDLKDESEELFKSLLDIRESVSKMLRSVEAVRVSNTLFDLEGDFKDLNNNENLTKQLKEKNLNISQLYDTAEFRSFSKFRMQWYVLYPEGTQEIEYPLYLILRFKTNKWNKKRIYYLNGDMIDFIDKLSSATIEFIKDDKSWFYNSDDGGHMWKIDTETKIANGEEVQGNDINSIFPSIIYMEDVYDLIKKENIKGRVY